MLEEFEQCRTNCLLLCNRLLTLLEENQVDARSFFAGEVYQAYDVATEKAKNKVQIIRNQIRNL